MCCCSYAGSCVMFPLADTHHSDADQGHQPRGRWSLHSQRCRDTDAVMTPVFTMCVYITRIWHDLTATNDDVCQFASANNAADVHARSSDETAGGAGMCMATCVQCPGKQWLCHGLQCLCGGIGWLIAYFLDMWCFHPFCLAAMGHRGSRGSNML